MSQKQIRITSGAPTTAEDRADLVDAIEMALRQELLQRQNLDLFNERSKLLNACLKLRQALTEVEMIAQEYYNAEQRALMKIALAEKKEK